MAARKILALAILVAPLVSASPVQPRAEDGFIPTPTWWFPGRPTSTLQPDPVIPGGPILPDPLFPGGELDPDNPFTGDDGDSNFNVGRAVADDPPPSFGLGDPLPPTLSPGLIVPGGPLVGDNGNNDGSDTSFDAEIAAAAVVCTYTLTDASAVHLPAPCTWDGTMTEYASTVTKVRTVDCHGCDHLQIARDTFNCPAMIIRGTTSVDTATTLYRTKCAPSAALTGTATGHGTGKAAAVPAAAVPVAAGAAEPTAGAAL
ncbi:hypothetical protein SPBR_03127 [Sporothrix brasiliensis 5110]|uniref:Uncharacterized protein n=1 Tax=Sporothrix brasiliensis 5110 TaxID=1398154 RepID=A0A0C2F186_9PEZI|nr:uncharacterized protein SPBR_03127 [Sporothrix brasiliensis 5110]KIH92629.1 hypothetical protein SPBR_03127 [Sporothrix brasiliensis 5110]